MPDAHPAPVPRARAALWTRALFIAVVVLPLAAAAILGTRRPVAGGRVLEVEMRATGGTVAQLFWSIGEGFYQEHSAVARLHQHPGQFETLRFPLPTAGTDFLRFDPIDGPGEAEIRILRVLDTNGRVVRTIDPMLLLPLWQIARQAVEPDGTVRYTTVPGANDPMLVMRAGPVMRPSTWHSLALVTPVSLAWVAIAIVVLIVTVFVVILRQVRAKRFGTVEALWLAAVGLVVVASRLLLLRAYPVPVPFWDQWDGELTPLYIPFANDALPWRTMFAFHNEHRIFFSRIQALSLLQVNGQWDPHLQILVNSLLLGAAAVLLAGITWVAAGRRWLPLVAAGVALAIASPFAVENSLAGFQSAFYYLLLFSMAAIWLMGRGEPGTSGWALGWLCAWCALFTTAGGLLALPVIALLAILRAASGRLGRRGLAITLAALVPVAVVGYAALSPPLPYHAYLKAESVESFGRSLARNLAFPWIESGRMSLLTWAPVAILGALVVRRRFRAGRQERWVLALGAWVVIQAAAIAYSRGARGVAPPSRYLDMFGLALVVNLAAVLTLAGRWSRRAIVPWVTGGLWLLVMGAGLWRLCDVTLDREAAVRETWTHAYIRNVQSYLRTGDIDRLLTLKGPEEIPYHTPFALGAMLQYPLVRTILPAAVRLPVHLQPAPGAPPTFTRALTLDGTVSWNSYGQARGSAAAFASAPVECREQEWLLIDVGGGAGQPGIDLHLHDVASGRDTPVRAGLVPESGWTPAIVRCPAGAFSVVAADTSAEAALTFREPAEIAWASALTVRAIRMSPLLALFALALALLAAGYQLAPAASATVSVGDVVRHGGKIP
jgi:hypothetical protein